MTKTWFALLAMALVPFRAFSVDGVVLINQSTVMAAGGFPYTIKDAGSYKLSGNLTVTTAADAIVIDSSDVTLDLNGFRITGPITCSGSPPTCKGTGGNGVSSTVSSNIVIKNGVIRGFGAGVFLVSDQITFGALLADLQASGNLRGIHVTNPFSSGGATVVRCSATNNGGNGIIATGGIISNSVANGNGFEGMDAFNATVSDSVANRNGLDGFVVLRSTLIHNAANDNGRYGIRGNFAGATDFLYGSNVLINNKNGAVSGGISQNNNLCDTGPC